MTDQTFQTLIRRMVEANELGDREAMELLRRILKTLKEKSGWSKAVKATK